MRTASFAIAALVALSAAAQDKKSNCRRCGNENFGTSVEWEGTPQEAAKKANAEEKLLFILHVSGNFEDPRFT
jgi:hypothetical protein